MKSLIKEYEWNEVLLAVLLLLPNLILLAIFTYWPVAGNIWGSLFNWNIADTPGRQFIGLDNYIELFTSKDFYTVLLNTGLFTLFAVGGCMGLGLIMALLLDQSLIGRGFVRSLAFAPFVVSGAAIGVAFQFVFDPNFGMVVDLLNRIGIDSPNFYQHRWWALVMVTITYIWKNVGYSFVIYLAALQGRRTELDEAAEIDGTSPFKHFWRVVLPQLRPTTFFLSITVLLDSVKVFDMINVMTKGGPFGNATTTMVFDVYRQTFVINRAGYGAAVATVTFIVLLIITLIQVRYMDKGK